MYIEQTQTDKQNGLRGLQPIAKKISQGVKLSAEESEAFERLKAEHGLTEEGTIKTVTALSKVLKVSRKTVYQWKKQPGFPVEPDGTYDPERIMAWRGAEVENQMELPGPQIAVSEKVWWEKEFRKFRALLAEVSYHKEKGELIPRAEVEALLVDRAVEFKKALLGRGRRLSLRLSHKDSKECQKILDADSLQILETYSRPNPLTDKTKPKKRRAKRAKKKA